MHLLEILLQGHDYSRPKNDIGLVRKGLEQYTLQSVGLKGWTLVTGQRSSRSFQGSSYEGGPGLTGKTFLQCNLWGFCPRTPSEELSVLLITPILGPFPLGRPPPPWFFFPFILVVTFLSMSTCKFYFLGQRLVLSAHT